MNPPLERSTPDDAARGPRAFVAREDVVSPHSSKRVGSDFDPALELPWRPRETQSLSETVERAAGETPLGSATRPRGQVR